MKQLFSALLIIVLFFQLFFGQPTLGQTTTNQTPPKAPPAAPAEIVPVEDLLPGDTLAYVVSTNLAGVLHSFQLLDAYKIAQARLPKVELEAGDNPLSIVTRFLSFGIENSRALEDTRIGVALIVPEIPERTEEQKKAIATNQNDRTPMPEPLILVFVEGTRIKDARQAREQVLAYYNETFRPIGKLSEIKQTDYKGIKLDRFKDGEVGAWFGATYVLSQLAGIDRLLTLRADRRAERLADDQEFMRVRTQMMPQTGVFAYLNGKPLNGLLQSVLGQAGTGGGFGGMNFLFAGLTGADAIKSAALSSTFDRDGVIDRLMVNFDAAKKNMLTTFFSGPKNEFKATKYIPAGTEILVSQSLDWVKIYDEIFVKTFYASAAQQELMQKYYAEQEAKRKEAEANNQKPPEMDWSGVSQRVKAELTEDVIQKKIKEREVEVNKELGFVLRDEAAKDLTNEVTVAYGIPKNIVAVAKEGEEGKPSAEGWAVFVGIKDRVATQQALIKAFSYVMGGMGNTRNTEDEEAQTNKPAKTEEQRKQERELRDKNAQSAWAMMPSELYKKVEIKSVFAAYLAFSDEYLIVADSKETIKQMVDVAEGGRALATDFNYSRAMSSLGGAGLTKVFIGPKMFDGILNDSIKSWVTNPNTLETDLSQRAPLNVPATAAAGIENDNGSLKLELFSPLGIAGTIALWGIGSDVKSATDRKENQARQQLRELVKAEKVYAKKHNNKYVALETLAKAKVTVFDVEGLKSEDENYKFVFKLKLEGKGYEATATPIKYGRQGRKSFFIDESGKMRMADKQGAVATNSDEIEDRQFESDDEAGSEGTPLPPPTRRKR